MVKIARGEEIMTNRERFLRVLDFKPVDRLPIIENSHWWTETIENWEREGLSVENHAPLNNNEAIQLTLGLDLYMELWINFTTATTPRPAYHGAPLARTMEEYERLKPTLYPRNAIDRERLRVMAKFQKSGKAITHLYINGYFWGPRIVLGIEPHLLAFYDAPELIHRINLDIVEHTKHVFDQVFDIFVPDFVIYAEDMSYNLGPMLSEAHFDEFILPYYRVTVPLVKRTGARVIVDSDGDISRTIPWFLRAGAEGMTPLERQAGVDVPALREKYPNFLFIGHFDKMVMTRGEEAIRAEFERLLPLMRKGGFIPSVDHQTPPGVSLDQYRMYLRLFHEYAQKAGNQGG